jgi:AcrR family transcriptional regulator
MPKSRPNPAAPNGPSDLAVPKSRRVGSLTLDAIVDESVRIVRSQGVAGLTMRSVAAGLGVTPMAIYYYVTDKDDLVRLVVGRVSDSFGRLRVDPDRSWQEVLRTYMFDIWQIFRRYPGLSSHLIDQPALGVTPDRLAAGIAFFEAAGFPPTEARLAWSFTTTYVQGRISVDARLAGSADASQPERLKARDYVAFGVDATIAGLEALLARQPTRYDEHGAGAVDSLTLAGRKRA